jgi:Protein of unknown function (DUF1688)
MDNKESIAYLRSPKAIREQSAKVFAAGLEGKLAHFWVRPEKLSDAAKLVLDVTRKSYPDFNVPYHSRWRHFDAVRLKRLDEMLVDKSPEDVARIKCELAIMSVLLDAGSGLKWKWKDDLSGTTLTKSEGLAAASFDMYLDGGFSADPDSPLQVDPIGLQAIGKKQLAAYFQVSSDNPLLGFDGRLNLLHRLGNAITSHPKIFGQYEHRLGTIFDDLDSHAGNGKLPARKILSTVLEGLGSIWPGRTSLAGTNLGDVWCHSALDPTSVGHGLVPFHKLSQWLTYSLMEPLEEAGVEVQHVEELTGLAEYRNGGLFVDTGVIGLKDPAAASTPHPVSSELVVEWRALTVTLLDMVAEHIRKDLGKSPLDLPLAKVLQGGTWAAGRQIALEKRPDGAPPIVIQSDGTVF